MNEHKLYLTNKIGWVMMLMFKYLPLPKFQPVIDLVGQIADQDDKDAARQAWEDFKNVKG